MRFLLTKIGLPLGIVLLSLGVAGYLINSGPEARPEPPTERARVVKTVAAAQVNITPTIKVFGEITAGREAELRAMVEGRLLVLNEVFRNGGQVAAGTVLAEIDRFDYEIAVTEALSELDEARARLAEYHAEQTAETRRLELIDDQIALSERDIARLSNLLKRSQSSEKALDDAKLALNTIHQQRLQVDQSTRVLDAKIKQQRAVIAKREALLARAERDLADTQLVAPFAGVIQDVVLAVGKRVSVGESLGRLIDSSALEVRFEISNRDYARILSADAENQGAGSPLLGRDITLRWDLGDTIIEYTGTIERRGAEIDPNTGGVIVFGRVTQGPRHLLRPGAFVEVEFPDRAYERVVVLPATAVSDESVVYAVEDGRLRPYSAEVVRHLGDSVLVRVDVDGNRELVAELFPGIGPGVLVEPRVTEAK